MVQDKSAELFVVYDVVHCVRVTEYCLEEQCNETEYMTLRALAMVDLKQQRTYGIKVQECTTVYVLYVQNNIV